MLLILIFTFPRKKTDDCVFENEEWDGKNDNNELILEYIFLKYINGNTCYGNTVQESKNHREADCSQLGVTDPFSKPYQ